MTAVDDEKGYHNLSSRMYAMYNLIQHGDQYSHGIITIIQMTRYDNQKRNYDSLPSSFTKGQLTRNTGT